MTKLYTEEQIMKAWTTAYIDALALDNEDYKPKFYDDFIASLTPIELASDEEIEKEFTMGNQIFVDRINGAKWIRDKIKGGDND